jgi:hypothetical protein
MGKWRIDPLKDPTYLTIDKEVPIPIALLGTSADKSSCRMMYIAPEWTQPRQMDLRFSKGIF